MLAVAITLNITQESTGKDSVGIQVGTRCDTGI